MTGIQTALAQINVTVGDLTGNSQKILDAARKAHQHQASLIVFPELTLSGYPPEDLVLKRRFLDDCEKQLHQLADQLPSNIVTIIGVPLMIDQTPRNAAAVVFNNQLLGIYSKMLLPNYSVFDEMRHFTRGDAPLILCINHHRIGIHICEDSWVTEKTPTTLLKKAGINALINLSASPYHRNKSAVRQQTLSNTANFTDAHLLYCNLVGGQDELVFDGASMVLAPDGTLQARAAWFKEDLLYFTVPEPATMPTTSLPKSVKAIEIQIVQPPNAPETPPHITPPLSPVEEVYQALTLGLGDYVNKNGFKEIVIASSGGIDSALVAALATDALGPQRVTTVTMPSQYTSEGTLSDAEQLAKNLNVKLITLPIKNLYDTYINEIEHIWEGRAPDITEENLQARIRGNIIMALSNKFGSMVLTTGNKSEMATGYCTIYGDMAGGFAVIKDVPKTLVFELCRWRNTLSPGHPVIPPTIITRPPSAELRPDQKDSDSLPPYDILDAILERYVEQDKGIQEIIDDGFDRPLVERVARLVDLNEYKRRQGPPGIKITPKAFGRDRRMPITNRYGELK